MRNIKLKSKIFVLALLMMTSLMIVPSKASAQVILPCSTGNSKRHRNVPYPSTTNIHFFWKIIETSKFSIADPGDKAYFRIHER